jgi:Family of unknown function (DUF6064)
MLPFTAEILFASMTQYNQALWPLPPVALLLGLGAVLLTVRPVRDSNRLISGYLAAAWLWVGIVYHMLHFARLDFAAPLYGGLFVLQGLLLLWIAVQDRVAFRFHGGPIGWVGLALAMLAVAWPLVDRVSGLAWQAERVVGLAPAPTTILTLALLLLADRRAPPYLAIIPLLWTLVAGATAWILWIPQDLTLPVVGLGGFALILWKNRRYAVSRARARRAG